MSYMNLTKTQTWTPEARQLIYYNLMDARTQIHMSVCTYVHTLKPIQIYKTTLIRLMGVHDLCLHKNTYISLI